MNNDIMSNVEPEEETYTYLFKVVLIGDSGVGKHKYVNLCILTTLCLLPYLHYFLTYVITSYIPRMSVVVVIFG